MNEDKKVFRVVVVYEFDGVDDPNSPDADMLVDEVTYVTKKSLSAADGINHYGRSVWVEDAYVVKGIWSVVRKKEQDDE